MAAAKAVFGSVYLITKPHMAHVATFFSCFQVVAVLISLSLLNTSPKTEMHSFYAHPLQSVSSYFIHPNSQPQYCDWMQSLSSLHQIHTYSMCKGTTYFHSSPSPTPIHFRPTPIRAHNSGCGYATPNSVRNSNYV